MNKIYYLLLLSLTIFFSCNVDVENVELSGYVYDSKGDGPIENVSLQIENYFYGNSPDQSYTGYKKFYLKTDENGFYSINLDTSALINIDVFKNGYSKGFKSKEFPRKKQKINFYLNKETN